jgi:flagellar protein FliO/FliZ
MSDATFHSAERKSSGPGPAAHRICPGKAAPHSWAFGHGKPAVVSDEPTARHPGSPGVFASVFRRLTASVLWAGLALAGTPALAEATNTLSLSPPLPNAGASLLRVLGGLVLVLAIFLGGVWLFRNWQRLVIQQGRAPRLNVLEVRSLGGRHALYVVGYEQERFLIASSPTGVNLVSHLPTADPAADATSAPGSEPPPTFAQSLARVLKGK